MDREEGEMSDDESMNVDDNSEPQEQQCNNTILYKVDKNGVIVEQLEKVDVAKLEERAKRFGIQIDSKQIVTPKEIDALYENFGMKGENLRHFRCDTLHLGHIQDLTTKDLFEYLQDFKPISLEWVDKDSCNIVCQDHISAALALLLHSREINNEKLNAMLKNNSPYHWREGIPHPKNDLILMRFATNSDKKVSSKNKQQGYSNLNTRIDTKHEWDKTNKKNPWGDLCQSWGIYDHQEIFHRVNHDDYENESSSYEIKNQKMASRLGKRHKYDKHSSDSDPEIKDLTQKKPRMRMRADDEELKFKKKKEKIQKEDTYLPLSVEVVNSQGEYKPKKMINLSDKFKTYSLQRQSFQKETVLSRLGEKVSHNSPDSNDQDDYISNRQNDEARSIWSRLEKKQEPSKSKTDLRDVLKTKKKPHDLRSLINKPKSENIHIEIDNNYY